MYINNVATFSKANAAFFSSAQCPNPYATILTGTALLDMTNSACSSGARKPRAKRAARAPLQPRDTRPFRPQAATCI